LFRGRSGASRAKPEMTCVQRRLTIEAAISL
jgi:hypothetical protein